MFSSYTNVSNTKLEDEPAVSVPDSTDTGEGGKLKMIVQLVKKCLGVKDIASMRLSLPASLLEPIPNLEYSHYLDRPDFFAAINDSDDPFMRMLAVTKFTFTKDLKLVHGKVVKPYNSVLGEHFRAHWDIVPFGHHGLEDTCDEKLQQRDSISLRSGTSSIAKSKSSSSTAATTSAASASTGLTLPEDDLLAQASNPNLTPSGEQPSLRVVYLTEQVSHHPPVSAYFATCPDRHIEMLGIDQISAKVSGTTIRVSPGEFNRGIFIRLTGGPGEGERYRITHPVASVNGILRGNFYLTVGDSVIITCEGGRDLDGEGKRLRTIIEYKEESWLGRAHFLLEGVVHVVYESDGERCEEWTKVKHVPRERLVACFEGSWRGGIKWRRVGGGSYSFHRYGQGRGVRSTASSPAPSHVKLPVPQMPLTSCSRIEFVSSSASTSTSISSLSSGGGSSADDPWLPLLDVSTLSIVPKIVRPLDIQHPRESRKLWEKVTDNLVKKEYSEATKEKVQIEQRQRDEAAERKRNGLEYIPRYFEKNYDTGWAELTEEGKLAIKEELKEDSGFCIEGSGVEASLA